MTKNQRQGVGAMLMGAALGIFTWWRKQPQPAPASISQARAYSVPPPASLAGEALDIEQPPATSQGESAQPVMSDTSQRLGIRSNNPLNIRYVETNQWLGLVGQSAGGYCIFSDPVYGIRAAAKVLNSYRRRGVVTLADIVRTWAPHEDSNPTDAYIKNVASWTGFDRDRVITEPDYPALLAAMIRQENGTQPYQMALIVEGVGLA